MWKSLLIDLNENWRAEKKVFTCKTNPYGMADKNLKTKTKTTSTATFSNMDRRKALYILHSI